MDKITIDRSKCIYCGGCTSVCPVNALELMETHIVCDQQKCVICGNCVKFCPVGAIRMKK